MCLIDNNNNKTGDEYVDSPYNGTDGNFLFFLLGCSNYLMTYNLDWLVTLAALVLRGSEVA